MKEYNLFNKILTDEKLLKLFTRTRAAFILYNYAENMTDYGRERFYTNNDSKGILESIEGKSHNETLPSSFYITLHDIALLKEMLGFDIDSGELYNDGFFFEYELDSLKMNYYKTNKEDSDEIYLFETLDGLLVKFKAACANIELT